MRKYRLGWPDLLLVGGLGLALNGFFYSSMAVLAAYAVLYHRASRRPGWQPAADAADEPEQR